MSLTDDHGPLLDAGAAIVHELRSFDGHMHRGQVDYAQHSDFALRARHLAMHLGGVQQMVEADLYPSAFSLLRTALENHLIDHLVFLGNRYVQVFETVSDDQWDELITAYEAGAPEAETISERPKRSRSGRVTVVREGLHASDDDPDEPGHTISPVYFVLRQYSPFVGRPSDQKFLDNGLTDVQDRIEAARRHRILWKQNLSWTSIKESLRRNGFYTDEQILQLEVHYRFLSAFAHATDAAYGLAYPRGITRGTPPVYDHYSSELALLYANAIAARELDALLEMARNGPEVEVPARRELEATAALSRQVSAHLWFPHDEPHKYDRVQEANRRFFRHFREYRELGAARSIASPPSELTPSEIGYYDNPLQRVVGLHSSSIEMTTGFSYQSPWERADAQFRM